MSITCCSVTPRRSSLPRSSDDRRSPHPVFARVVPAENLADLLGKSLVAGRRRLVAALYAFGKSGIIDVLPDS